MGYPKGYNPLRWDCKKRGCFNIKRRPKIEVFADCFPGNINFGDVDGIVEINGKALFLEWKTNLNELPLGQKIMYQRLTETRLLTVFCVVGNAETMEISHYSNFVGGNFHRYKTIDLDGLKERIKLWVDWANSV